MYNRTLPKGGEMSALKGKRKRKEEAPIEPERIGCCGHCSHRAGVRVLVDDAAMQPRVKVRVRCSALGHQWVKPKQGRAPHTDCHALRHVEKKKASPKYQERQKQKLESSE